MCIIGRSSCLSGLLLYKMKSKLTYLGSEASIYYNTKTNFEDAWGICVIEVSVLSILAGSQNVSCLEFFGWDICSKH